MTSEAKASLSRLRRTREELSRLARAFTSGNPSRVTGVESPGPKHVTNAPLAVGHDLDRFFALVRRELGAAEVTVLEAGAAPPADEARELRCTLPDGQVVAIRYDAPPPDRDALRRRLEMLASTFDTIAEEAAPGPRSRPPVGRLLREELQKLCERSGAVNALVIDANSPILWGAAWPRDVASEAGTAFGPQPEDVGPTSEDQASVAATSRKALEAVRKLGDLAALRKGKRGRHVEREGDAPFVAHSFAGIYLLTLVFDAPFDELRAERAVVESLSRIEALVLALPPLDPPPRDGGGVVAIRRSRRR
jgi:hypothetical protein